MRRLVHVVMSPPCRMARLMLGEKRLAFAVETADDPLRHLPMFFDEDGSAVTGIWAVIDRLEAEYPEHPLVPEDAVERAEMLRLLDWIANRFHDETTRRIVFEKAAQAHTGNPLRRPPNMELVRSGRAALAEYLKLLGPLPEERGFLACRDLTLADLALAAHLSALDYYGEVPWTDIPAIAEWYTRIKSRPSFRPLLSDRVPGQPPVPHYAELDF